MEVLELLLFAATFSALSVISCGQTLSKTFRMYNKLKPSLPISESFAVDARLRCHGACVRREGCFSFLVTDTSCNIYGRYITDANTELLPVQPGEIFNTLIPAEVVLQTIKSLTTGEGNGNLHVLPAYPVKTGGRVIQWQFRCSSAGVIVMAMWRPVSTNVHQLVGRTRITVTEDMANNEIIMYGMPSTESFLVEEGDYMGFHSTNTAPPPKIHVDYRNNAPQDGFVDKDYSIVGFDDSLKDEDFEIGDHFTQTSPLTPKRIVSLAVYIA